MLFLTMTKSSRVSENLPSTSFSPATSATASGSNNSSGMHANVAGAPNLSVKEDLVDIALDKLDGKIERKRNEAM